MSGSAGTGTPGGRLPRPAVGRRLLVKYGPMVAALGELVIAAVVVVSVLAIGRLGGAW